MAHFPRKLALLALAAAAACSDTAPSSPPPVNRFYYPTGLAVRKLASGHTQLVVASSNFDLLYDTASGGTVIAVDVDATLQGRGAKGEPIPLVNPSVQRMGSFAGELAIAEGVGLQGAPATCPGWTGAPQALVASRSEGAFYSLDLDAAGDGAGVSCTRAGGCRLALDTTLDDPYSVTLACGTFPASAGATPTPQRYAYVGYLRTQAAEGILTRIDLASGAPAATLRVDASVGTAASAAFDPVTARLYVTSRFIAVGTSPLRWLELDAPEEPTTIVDIDPLVRGSEMRGIALSTFDPARPRRGYLPLRLYDFDLATTIGRPPTDVGAALAVLDLSDQPGGAARTPVLRVVPLPLGANEVRVIPRAGKRDLVAVTSSDGGSLTLYDDEAGSVARVFGTCGARDTDPAAPCRPGVDDGKPALGQQPFGLAVEDFAAPDAPGVPLARLFVGSFDRSWVNVIEIDPANPTATAAGAHTLQWDRIGQERP